jgi:hypothetical protein
MAAFKTLIDLLVDEGFADFVKKDVLYLIIREGDIKINHGPAITNPFQEIDPDMVDSITVGRFTFPGPVKSTN